MRILVKFPSRERPARFRQVLQQWISKADDLSRISWLFSFDLNDATMRKMGKEVESMGIDAQCVYGRSTGKIHAINRDINDFSKPWDILIVLSDDMVCYREHWDLLVRQDMELYYPDCDGLLWFFDGKQMDICTLPIMGRKYYDRFRHVYHPSYVSVFADDEQTAIAKAEGRLIFFEDMLAMHQHPANCGDVKPDALYRKNETTAIWRRDEANYKCRKALGFPK